jgi:hypothetical protein
LSGDDDNTAMALLVARSIWKAQLNLIAAVRWLLGLRGLPKHTQTGEKPDPRIPVITAFGIGAQGI